MARPGRYFIPDQPLHLIQRGNNGGKIFFADDDRALYLRWLDEAARDYGCAIHAYVLMPNHVHLLATPDNDESLARTIQSLGRRYVRYVNHARGRTGTLWEGRYRAAPIDSDRYLLACCRYIELNPVRAGKAKHPRAWRWSSYRANAEGRPDPLLTPHTLYRALGRTAEARRAAYRALFGEPLGKEFVAELRAATNGGWAMGSDPFKRAIAKALKRRVMPLPRGRPPKEKTGKRKKSDRL